MKKTGSSMAEVLKRAGQGAAPDETPDAAPPGRRARAAAAEERPQARKVKPSREKTMLIGGHFPRETGKKLKVLAAEEETTVQKLLDEAINLLFAKKAVKDLPRPRRKV